MHYVDRDKSGNITGAYSVPQYKGQERLKKPHAPADSTPVKEDYKQRRQKEYPSTGDQLDVAYKDRVARQLAAGRARKALEDNDLASAVSILIEAIDAGDDADAVDGRITAVKSAIKKPKV